MAHYRAVAQAAAATNERIGVLLVNLGAPDSSSYFAVQRYLRELLGDRRVIDTSRWVWLPLLYGVILPFRPLRTRRTYCKVWMADGSPLTVYSRRLAAKLDTLLQSRLGFDVRVMLGMTYGNPGIAAGIASLAEQNVKRLLILPLYPQYCSSTTGSAFDRASQVLRRWRWLPETRFVNDYYADRGYLDALADSVRRHWQRVGGSTHLVFSYHGMPARYVANGDPYKAQAEATTGMVVARLGLAPEDFSHCYQPHLGPVEGLQPGTEETLEELLRRGVRKLTVVSPSFACDCVETLEELAVEYRDKFLALGGESLTSVPALNDDDPHVEALAGIVQTQLRGWI
ncbi:MAG: ferrochelatase [Pseudomonadota bacterium]|nr:ferrochelatase [Pseudomonadota bacterium]